MLDGVGVTGSVQCGRGAVDGPVPVERDAQHAVLAADKAFDLDDHAAVRRPDDRINLPRHAVRAGHMQLTIATPGRA
ncbi:hypothetical protein GCM10018963_64050 [Saccharothrix longispora]